MEKRSENSENAKNIQQIPGLYLDWRDEMAHIPGLFQQNARFLYAVN